MGMWSVFPSLSELGLSASSIQLESLRERNWKLVQQVRQLEGALRVLNDSKLRSELDLKT